MADITHNLALIGFGVVGQALAEIIHRDADSIQTKYGQLLKICTIATQSRGMLYHPDGLNIEAALAAATNLADYPDTEGLIRDWSVLEIAAKSNADTLIEISYTDLQTGQPAIDYCETAIKNGKNVVAANKGPLALAYGDLAELANVHDVAFAFESTVMAGTPAIGGGELFRGNEISAISGILNGTTNYILTQMEATGASFDDALADAQQLGYAEADPSGDVDGHDAAAKVAILANVFMQANIGLADVTTTGIRDVTADDIATATVEGMRWKLIGRVERQGERIVASVSPMKLPITDPLANVGGATNAITYETALVGPVTLVGAGAGGQETAAGILADILAI